MSCMRGTIVLAAIAALALPAGASIVIDRFEQGYFRAEFVGTGARTNLATGLDRSRCFAGHRNTTSVVNFNPFGYRTSVEVGLGEVGVTTPGPTDLSTELRMGYGAGFFEPMDLDLSAFSDSGRLFELDLVTHPPELFAQVWSIRLEDGLGRITANHQFGTIPGGIGFRRDGFVGNPAFDWSDVDGLIFRQDWNAQNTAPFSYWTTEIRAVPEPYAMLALGALALAGAARARRRA
ncbi:MAG: PEP-CTERM sorting domain-containing protein [Fimbriimonadaceae bacterium]|nr:PEP-CTERM sorting domain-containing protein [Fimbriimonadaceae bacterium]